MEFIIRSKSFVRGDWSSIYALLFILIYIFEASAFSAAANGDLSSPLDPHSSLTSLPFYDYYSSGKTLNDELPKGGQLGGSSSRTTDQTPLPPYDDAGRNDPETRSFRVVSGHSEARINLLSTTLSVLAALPISIGTHRRNPLAEASSNKASDDSEKFPSSYSRSFRKTPSEEGGKRDITEAVESQTSTALEGANAKKMLQGEFPQWPYERRHDPSVDAATRERAGQQQQQQQQLDNNHSLCPPSLPTGHVEWSKGNRIGVAYLPHTEPSACDPPVKCSVSTTVHRHISIQEGDSLQVILQRLHPPPPPNSSSVSFGSIDVSKASSASAATRFPLRTDGPNDKPILHSNNEKGIERVRGNVSFTNTTSTHLFSRDDRPSIKRRRRSRKREANLDDSMISDYENEALEDLEDPQSILRLSEGDDGQTSSGSSTQPTTLTPSTAAQGDDKSSLTIWKVTKSEWTSCSTREGGQVAQSSSSTGAASIGQDFLPVGVNYFIGRSSWSSTECFKLKVMVRTADCGEGSICSGKGICFTNSSMEEFECGCCRGYTGRHCEERDACADMPCLNAGICLDIQEGHDGATFQCLCPYGYRGRLCEMPSSLCDSNPCQNGGFCEGNHTSYKCHCSSEWTGFQCMDEATNEGVKTSEETRRDDADDDFTDPLDEVDNVAKETEVSEGCANGPCVHGVCVETTAQDYRCFCQPGFGGERCEMEYDECYSNPCPNGGTCVDRIGSFQCLCGPGYRGPNCLTKVNLCMPDPCPPNRVCKDKGNSYICECVQELSDDDCGKREEACVPNPCFNGGTCYTIAETLSFYCACRPGFTGQTCQDAAILESVNPYGTGEPAEDLDSQHSTFSNSPLSHLRNVYTGAVTLACAFIIFILVVSVCHCRVNRPYSKCFSPLSRSSLRFLQPFARARANSSREKKRRERSSASMRLEGDMDGTSSTMSSHANSDSVFYNMDVCDNQELPLIK